MKTILSFVAVSLFAMSATAQAEEPTKPNPVRTSSQADASAYCDMVSGVADSEAALLVAPTVFGSIGVISGADAAGGGSSLPPRGRVLAGASYSVGSLVRGVAVKNQAAAECKRYRAESALRSFIESSQHGRSAGALASKVSVIETALVHARELVRAQRAAVAESRGTIDDLEALEMRTDTLRAAAHDAQREIDAMNGAVAPPPEPVDQILRERDEAEKDVQRREAQVRSAMGWDLSARGGYEQILDAPSHVPVFGAVTLSVNLGWFTQGSGETRAQAGRQAWVRQQVEGIDDRTELAVQRMRAMRSSEQARLVEARGLLADLDTRQKAAESMTGERAKVYAQALWFDRVIIEAEHAYLVTHLKELESALPKATSAQ